jgi:hypothetical protein
VAHVGDDRAPCGRDAPHASRPTPPPPLLCTDTAACERSLRFPVWEPL